MWVLLLFLVIAVAIAIERLLYLYSTYIPFESFPLGKIAEPPNDRENNREKNRENSGEEPISVDFNGKRRAVWLRLERHLPLGRQRLKNNAYFQISNAYQQRWNAPEESRNSAVERAGSELIAQMERRIGGLNIIAAVAPLVGLLGTILGMMQTFQQISVHSNQVEISQLAGGIWTALLTTAFGLTVAIPSHLIYNFLRSILNGRIHRMNAIVQYLEENRSSQLSTIGSPGNFGNPDNPHSLNNPHNPDDLNDLNNPDRPSKAGGRQKNVGKKRPPRMESRHEIEA